MTDEGSSVGDRRREHDKEHERERQVAKDTAERLEREVEHTAQRLERVVEETALRIEKAVHTALTAVTETARVHSEAHRREHQSHERIHAVEKTQVDKAEESMNKRLEGMNEFRASLQDQANRTVSRELFDAAFKELDTKIDLTLGQTSQRLGVLERRADQQAGKSEGLTTTAKVVVGAAGLVLAIVSIVSLVLAFNN